MTRMHDNGMWSIQTTLPGFLEYIFSGEPLLYGWLVPTAIHCLIAKSLKRVLPVSNRRLASQTNPTWSGQLRLGASSERTLPIHTPQWTGKRSIATATLQRNKKRKI